jgi:serine/threonine protein kinase
MIGKTILHYKRIEKLGEEGMNVVYLAEDTKLERKVAIKFLSQNISY